MTMKRALALSIGVFLLAVFANASLSRTDALGPASRHLMDDADIFTWPNLTWFFTRGMFIELGEEASAVAEKSSVLATYSSAEKTLGVFGVAVNRRSPALLEFSGYLDPAMTVDESTVVKTSIIELLQDRGLGANLFVIPAPENEFDLFYARQRGKLTAGIRLEYASAREGDEYTGSSYQARSSIVGAALACGYEFSNRLRLDAGMGVATLSFLSEYKLELGNYSEALKSEGGRGLYFSARTFYSLNDELALVPVLSVWDQDVGYSYAQSGWTEEAAGNTGTTRLSITAGLQFRPNPRVLLASGLEADYMKTEVTDSLIAGSPGEAGSTITTTALPRLSIGLEVQLNKWLLLRCGASKERSTKTTERDFTDGSSQKLEVQTQPYSLAAGFGIKAGNLALDLVTDPELLYTGGKVFSGSSTRPVNRASVSYRF